MSAFKMTIKKIFKAKIKLEEFNNCPGSKQFLDLANECEVKGKFVNILNERTYQTWRNGVGTVVFMLNKKTTFKKMLDVIEFIQGLRPEEFNYTYSPKGNVIFRLWWD